MLAEKKHLLTTKQMASFVANGFLRFDEFIPKEINEEVMHEFNSGFKLWEGYHHSGTPLYEMWKESKGIGKLWRLPQVVGVTQSLVGPNPLYDHHAGHQVAPHTKEGQFLHQDSIIDTRTAHFDIQYYYFPHDTPREMGGTMIVPGSHFRMVNTFEVSRYQNFINQHKMICKAGTLVATHMNMWHCAQPNTTDTVRYMFKLRLNPTVKQLRLWNTDDIDDPQIGHLLNTGHGWYGNEHRFEIVNRIKMWRSLTGNERFDLALWLGRLENTPENVLQTA